MKTNRLKWAVSMGLHVHSHLLCSLGSILRCKPVMFSEGICSVLGVIFNSIFEPSAHWIYHIFILPATASMVSTLIWLHASKTILRAQTMVLRYRDLQTTICIKRCRWLVASSEHVMQLHKAVMLTLRVPGYWAFFRGCTGQSQGGTIER